MTQYEFGHLMNAASNDNRLENLLRTKDIDFYETKNIKSVEYNSIDEMIENGCRISLAHLSAWS